MHFVVVLSVNVPHRLLCLTPQYPAGGAVWKGRTPFRRRRLVGSKSSLSIRFEVYSLVPLAVHILLPECKWHGIRPLPPPTSMPFLAAAWLLCPRNCKPK